MGIAEIVIISVAALIVAAVAVSAVLRKLTGRGSCGCDCSQCRGCRKCKTTKRKDKCRREKTAENADVKTR